MKISKWFLYAFLCLNTCYVSSQNKLNYTYDNAGNRIERVIPLSVKAISEVQPVVFEEEIAQRIVKIYPNPTKGQLAVEISDTEKLKSGKLFIYNMKGQLILNKKIVSTRSDLDISSKSNGVYILYIDLDGERSSWKIIKE